MACLLFMGLPALGQESAFVPTNILVRTCSPASPTLAWAVERIVAELRTVHGMQTKGEVGGAEPFDGVPTDAGVVVLGRPGESAPLRRWSREHEVDWAAAGAGADGYHFAAQAKPFRVVIAADTDVGLWYGACVWLDSLRAAADGAVFTPCGEFGGAPALAYRFTRGLTPGAMPSRIEEAIPWLDWWARWRLNVTVMGRQPEPFLRVFLAEAHKRGIRVVRSLGVRNLCATDDQAVARCAEEFRGFLELGGDGVSALWDDLPHERCHGHCDRCGQRFGTNSLPHEIVHVLEALCEVAARSPRQPLIFWCPSHYSENRYPELSDEDFFRVIGASQKVRQQTHVYHCEFDPAKTVVLDAAGITNRVWWYNGLRTVYHVCHHWPTPPGVKLTIPGVKSFDAPDFARFEVGWKTGIRVRADGGTIPVPEQTWQGLRTLPARYQGYYPCTAAHPYHAAVSGLFAFNPREFNQAEADRVVFRALFGPGSAKAARAWSDAYVQLQVRLAQTADGSSTATQRADLEERLAEWRALLREVRACAAQGRSLLVPPLRDSALVRMSEAEEAMEKIARQAGRAEKQLSQ